MDYGLRDFYRIWNGLYNKAGNAAINKYIYLFDRKDQFILNSNCSELQ